MPETAVLGKVEPAECVFLLDYMHAVFLSWKSRKKNSNLHAYSWLITCSFWCEKWLKCMMFL